MQVEQPHVNVLSKVDLIEKYGKLPFNLDFFTDVLDLSYLMEHFPVSLPILINGVMLFLSGPVRITVSTESVS